jgi:hypothetical protein
MLHIDGSLRVSVCACACVSGFGGDSFNMHVSLCHGGIHGMQWSAKAVQGQREALVALLALRITSSEETVR